MFPNIQWHKLDRSYVSDSINRARAIIPNMVVNSTSCDWVMECFENWEYRQLSSIDDWSAQPKHDRYSHICDSFRYCADFMASVPYIKESSGLRKKFPSHYGAWNLDEDEELAWDDMPPGMRPSKFSKLRKKTPNQIYGDMHIE